MWTVVGQDPAVSALRRALDEDRVAHAYVFAGAAHVGKTLTALQFAQALNCEREDRPCGRCRQCELIASGAHPDVEVVTVGGLCDESEHAHSASDRGIRICQVRRLERVISRAPFQGRHRVQIIEPADLLNREAEVALLKTLEEPPPYVVIILVTPREDVLLDTIRSRARRVAFGGMPVRAVEQALRTRWDVEASRAAQLAALSGGRIGWAVIALNDAALLEDQDRVIDDAETLARAPVAERFARAGELGSRYARDRVAVQEVLELWQRWWRDVVVVAAGREQDAWLRARLDTLRVVAAQCGIAAAARAVRAIGDARQQLEENASPVLALEVMMLALPDLAPRPVASTRMARG